MSGANKKIGNAFKINGGKIGVGSADISTTKIVNILGDINVTGNFTATTVTTPTVNTTLSTATKADFLKWLSTITNIRKGAWWCTATTPLYSDGPAIGGTNISTKFSGGVLMFDGRVLLVPEANPAIGIYNPSTGEYSNGPTIPTSAANSNKFTGGVLLPDGRVLLVPMSYANIGIYNPATGLYADGPAITTSGTVKFNGGVLLPDGRVLLVPTNYANVGIYTPSTTGGTGAYADGDIIPTAGGTSSRFIGGVLMTDGRVLLVPYRYANIGIYDPLAAVGSQYSNGPAISGNSKFYGGVLMTDGRVLLVPMGYANIGIYNPSAAVGSEYTDGPAPSIITFQGGVLLPDGRVLFVPTNSITPIGIYDPSEADGQQYKTVSTISLVNKFKGGVLMPDGRVLLVPKDSPNIGIVSGFPPVPIERCLHPCFNKF